jgi:hypothetical protein
MNISPQTINNWEDRGISNEGLLRAQEQIGCDAIWLRDGNGTMTGNLSTPVGDEVIELLVLYQQATPTARKMILDLARESAKTGALRWIRSHATN